MAVQIAMQSSTTAHWDARGSDSDAAGTANFSDLHLREREIDTLCRYLARTPRAPMLDIGCGNGRGTLTYAARLPDAVIRGEDISSEMIGYAQDAIERQPKRPANLSFGVGDVLNLVHLDESFEIVSTCRVLVSLGTVERQRLALREIHRVLAPHGTYLMLESFRQSYGASTRCALSSVCRPWSPTFRACTWTKTSWWNGAEGSSRSRK